MLMTATTPLRRPVLIALLALAAILTVWLSAPPTAQAEDRPKPAHIIIGLDISKSNPLVENAAYAQKAAERIRPMLLNLPPRSQVMLRTFGSYSADAPQLRIDKVISAKERPEDVAALMTTVVAGVPKLVADQKLKPQDETNILAFLGSMQRITECRDNDTQIILVTDGVEDSGIASLKKGKLTIRPRAKPIADGEEAVWNNILPEPTRLFRSCKELQMLGVGFGHNDPIYTERLLREWTAWSDAAGFRDFVGLDDW